MKDEIKEILDKLKKQIDYPTITDLYCNLGDDECKLLLDYITNLQEKSNNQTEEINRLVKQREKFMKKYGYLQEENERLKQLCDEYEEEHSTEFKIWKDERYQLLDYKSRNEKAIEFVKKESKKCYSNQTTDDPQKVIGNFMWHTDKLLNILNGGDEDGNN